MPPPALPIGRSKFWPSSKQLISFLISRTEREIGSVLSWQTLYCLSFLHVFPRFSKDNLLSFFFFFCICWTNAHRWADWDELFYGWSRCNSSTTKASHCYRALGYYKEIGSTNNKWMFVRIVKFLPLVNVTVVVILTAVQAVAVK